MTTDNSTWRGWHKELVTPSKNSYVYKLGYRYAILWYQQHTAIEVCLKETFGAPARSYYYNTWHNSGIQIKPYYQPFQNRRWFYGSQRWGEDRLSNKCFWAVFKTDQDRTLALLTL